MSGSRSGSNDSVEGKDEYTKRVTVYKNLLKGAAFFSNGDTVTALANGATETFAGAEKVIDYKYSGGASIASSSIAIIIIAVICFKSWCFDSTRRNISLPSTYLTFLFFSCILSIVGSVLLITDQNLHPKNKQNATDLHIAGALLFALAKLMNPVFASTLVVADSLEQSVDSSKENTVSSESRGDRGNDQSGGAGNKPGARRDDGSGGGDLPVGAGNTSLPVTVGATVANVLEGSGGDDKNKRSPSTKRRQAEGGFFKKFFSDPQEKALDPLEKKSLMKNQGDGDEDEELGNMATAPRQG